MTKLAQQNPGRRNGWIPVWDPLIRIGHWVLLAAVAVALITRGEPEILHLAAGYLVAGYIILRAIWGFIGPGNAKFSHFLTSPRVAIRYLIGLLRGRSRRYLGHSPAGGWMIIALLIALSGTVATGLAIDYRFPVPVMISGNLSSGSAEDLENHVRSDNTGGEREGENESPWGEAHEAFSNLVLGLAVLHVMGVGLASLAHHENLARAMVTGRKRRDTDHSREN